MMESRGEGGEAERERKERMDGEVESVKYQVKQWYLSQFTNILTHRHTETYIRRYTEI